jgi:hypothetical protein
MPARSRLFGEIQTVASSARKSAMVFHLCGFGLLRSRDATDPNAYLFLFFTALTAPTVPRLF